MSTDLTAKPRPWVRCVYEGCEDLVRNDPGARRAHIDRHEELGQIRQSLVYLGKEIDGLRKELRDLRGTTPEPATTDDTVGEWPDEDFPDDTDTPATALAAIDTIDPTIDPGAGDDLEDPTSDDLDSRAATILNAPITYGQTGVIA